jgi:hypothetical protein
LGCLLKIIIGDTVTDSQTTSSDDFVVAVSLRAASLNFDQFPGRLGHVHRFSMNLRDGQTWQD